MKRAVVALFVCAILISGCARAKGSGQALEPNRSQYRQQHAVPYLHIPDHVLRMQRTSVPSSTMSKEPPSGTEQENVSSKPDKPKSVKGIYVSAWKATGSSLDKLIKLIDETELNAAVIDLKNDSGQVTYDSKVPLVDEINSDETRPIPDIKAVLQRMKQRNIYTIARVAAFKDPYLCSVRSDLAMHTKTGAVWRDRKGVSWVDPYNEEVQAYALAIAKEAQELGFDEIQFDYVRFPENGQKVDREVRFQNPRNQSKAELIRDFLRKARREITTANLSADVFGLTSSTTGDMGIGQDWMLLSSEVDYLSPMIYPSHYSNGSLGVQYPDLEPYRIVKQALTDALDKNAQISNAAAVRPWLQDFTATWVKPHQKYGAVQVGEQIKAAKELGIDQFLLWNPSCTYSYRD